MLETELDLTFHANFKKYEKLHDVSMKHFFVKKNEKFEKIKNILNRFYYDSTAKILLKTEIDLTFHTNLKKL